MPGSLACPPAGDERDAWFLRCSPEDRDALRMAYRLLEGGKERMTVELRRQGIAITVVKLHRNPYLVPKRKAV